MPDNTAESGGMHVRPSLSALSHVDAPLMLIRTVRMTFLPDALDAFRTLFAETADEILGFSGCERLELWSDVRYPNILSTFSVWTDENALDAYRRSPLFALTWAKTREMFAAPPEARSHRLEVEVAR